MMSLQLLHFLNWMTMAWQTAQSGGEVVDTGWVTGMKSSSMRGWPKSWSAVEAMAVG
jgi:hypothetical protein